MHSAWDAGIDSSVRVVDKAAVRFDKSQTRGHASCHDLCVVDYPEVIGRASAI